MTLTPPLYWRYYILSRRRQSPPVGDRLVEEEDTDRTGWILERLDSKPNPMPSQSWTNETDTWKWNIHIYLDEGFRSDHLTRPLVEWRIQLSKNWNCSSTLTRDMFFVLGSRSESSSCLSTLARMKGCISRCANEKWCRWRTFKRRGWRWETYLPSTRLSCKEVTTTRGDSDRQEKLSCHEWTIAGHWATERGIH